MWVHADFALGKVMTEKPEFVDLIKDATQQHRPKPTAARIEVAPVERPRIGNWPPPRWAQWRMDLRKPWKA